MEKSKKCMNLIDFSVLTDIFSNTLDKDRIDIGRKTTITSEDGWEEETDPKIPLYEDVECHIQPITLDNPDVGNTPSKPVITSFLVHCKPTTDIKNGDYITLKTCNSNGDILEVQYGIAGEPKQYVSRIEFAVGVQKWI